MIRSPESRRARCPAGSRRARPPARATGGHAARPAARAARRCRAAPGCGTRSSCLPQRRNCRSRKPSGRPKSARPTAAGSTACSATSVSTSARTRSRVRAGPSSASCSAVRYGVPVDMLHHVEGRADHVGVLAQQHRARDRHVRLVQRADHPVLAAHVVRGGEHVARAAAGAPPRCSLRRSPGRSGSTCRPRSLRPSAGPPTSPGRSRARWPASRPRSSPGGWSSLTVRASLPDGGTNPSAPIMPTGRYAVQGYDTTMTPLRAADPAAREGQAVARAAARPAMRPENRHPPRNVPSSDR